MGQVWNQLPCTASDHLSVMRLDALPSLCIFLPHLPGAWGFRHNLIAVLRTEGSTCQHFQGNVEWQKKGTSPPLAQPRRCLRPPRLQITSEWGRTPSRQQGCTEKAPNGWAAPHKRVLSAPSPGLWTVIPACYGPPATARESRGLPKPPPDVGGGIEPTHQPRWSGRKTSKWPASAPCQSAPGLPPRWTKGHRSWSPHPRGKTTFSPPFVCPGHNCAEPCGSHWPRVAI